MELNKNIFVDSILHELISSISYPAHLKDGKTNKYINVNSATLNFYGLENSKQLIGKTIQDVDIFMHKNWGDTFVNDVNKFEYDVKNRKEKILGAKHVIMLKDGRLIIQQMEKTPIVDKNGKVSSILTFSYNRINDLNTNELFVLYKNYFKEVNLYVGSLLKHFELGQYFITLPTELELQVFLAQKLYDTEKDIAIYLRVELNLVKKCINSLQDKIRNHDIVLVLYHLRNFRNPEFS